MPASLHAIGSALLTATLLSVPPASTPAVGVAIPIAAPSSPEADGHWILCVEGDVTDLRVTSVTVKADPLGPTDRDPASPFEVVARDAAGRELTRRGIDLRAYDLDPARVGTAPRVEGCRLITSRIAALVSIHGFAEARTLEIVRGGRLVSRVDTASVRTVRTATTSREGR